MHPYEQLLTPQMRLRLAQDEGTRVAILALQLLLETYGAKGARELLHTVAELEPEGPSNARAATQLLALLDAATAHVATADADAEGAEQQWIAVRDTGAGIYALTLEALARHLGPDRVKELATRMDELSVGGSDVFAVRALLGMPPKPTGEEGTMEDWANFMGTAWAMLADPGTDWEWSEFSASKSILRVHRCPYWTSFSTSLRADAPCEQGCSGFLDKAAQDINPRFRLRGDASAADKHLGYRRSLPKGDACCELEVAVAPESPA